MMNETTNRETAPLKFADGLCIAIVKHKDTINQAAHELSNAMDKSGAHTGILLVGTDFARSFFGPVPQDWLNRGIGIVVSESEDMHAEAEALLSQYELGAAAVETNLRRLNALAGQRVRQTHPEAYVEPRMSDTRKNRQYVSRDPVVTRNQVREPAHATQQSAMCATSGTMQQSGGGGSMSGSLQSSGSTQGASGSTADSASGGSSVSGASSGSSGSSVSGASSGSSGSSASSASSASGATTGTTGGGSRGRNQQGGSS